tara:strand:- start:328 stop:774 length:447 start_codon:yes stop_codon:yes gene_type:complete
VNVLGAACTLSWAGGGCTAKRSDTTTCSLFYGEAGLGASFVNCIIDPITGNRPICAQGVTACTPLCDVVRSKTTSNCKALATGTCPNYYKTGATEYVCSLTPGSKSCTTNAKCVPEFAGIYFPEMQFSTGIIALLVAIALSMWLFKKR